MKWSHQPTNQPTNGQQGLDRVETSCCTSGKSQSEINRLETKKKLLVNTSRPTLTCGHLIFHCVAPSGLGKRAGEGGKNQIPGIWRMSIRSESALNTGWCAYGFDAFFGLSVCEWFRVELRGPLRMGIRTGAQRARRARRRRAGALTSCEPMITKVAGVVPKVTFSNPFGSVSPVPGKPG